MLCAAMHFRKGSFGHRPFRSRVGIRWSGVLFFISILFLLSYPSTFRYWILPSSHLSSNHSSCPASPPSPSLISTPNGRFRWKDIPTHYPVKTFAQLPPRTSTPLPKIQHDFSRKPLLPSQQIENAHRQAAIKAIFLRSYSAYKTHAWKQDELLPLSNSSKTTLGGWGLTLVTSLSTLWLMDLHDEFAAAVASVSEIDFAPKDIEINVAEVTTHYLGGVLSAYDLTGCKEPRLLHKAMELGDMLYAAFDTPNHLPITQWNPLKAAAGEVQEASPNTSLADLTSFIPGFIRLSQLTGDMRYYDAAARITALLSSQQNSTAIPGLWPSSVDMRTADLIQDRIFTPDATYAALLQTSQLLHSTSASEQSTTKLSLSLRALLPTLLFRPITPFSADILTPTTASLSPSNVLTRTHTTHSSFCFLGATLGLASRLLANATLLPYARRVTESCIWSHITAPHGLPPESFMLLACASSAPSHDAENCMFDASVWPPQEYPGFEKVLDGRYGFRPEAVLSVLVMYRVTGEERYREEGWKMWRAVEAGTRVREGGNVVVGNVMHDDGRGLEKVDEMPSIWLAATLKFFYLLFSEQGVGSLDEWVVGEGGQVFRLQ